MDEHQFEVEGAERPYVRHAPTGKPKEYLNTLLFNRATRRNRKDPYEEKRYRGADIDAVTRYWKQCSSWMAQYKGYVEPYTFNFKKLLKALYHKEGAAQSLCEKVADARRHVSNQATTSRMSGIRLSTWWQILTWLTFKTGHMEKYTEVEESF